MNRAIKKINITIKLAFQSKINTKVLTKQQKSVIYISLLKDCLEMFWVIVHPNIFTEVHTGECWTWGSTEKNIVEQEKVIQNSTFL